MSSPFHLDHRIGLPDEWLFLLSDHPRQVWHDHENLGPLAQFWLSRHDGFRDFGKSLEVLLKQFREGQLPPDRFAGMLAPRLQHFLSELNAHHMIEDHQYFPIFMEAEPRLTKGFELLETDHELIHQKISMLIGSANTFLGALSAGDGDKIRRAADEYAGSSSTLLTGLLRHLHDEEDLIVPVILERGETDLGLS